MRLLLAGLGISPLGDGISTVTQVQSATATENLPAVLLRAARSPWSRRHSGRPWATDRRGAGVTQHSSGPALRPSCSGLRGHRLAKARRIDNEDGERFAGLDLVSRRSE